MLTAALGAAGLRAEEKKLERTLPHETFAFVSVKNPGLYLERLRDSEFVGKIDRFRAVHEPEKTKVSVEIDTLLKNPALAIFAGETVLALVRRAGDDPALVVVARGSGNAETVVAGLMRDSRQKKDNVREFEHKGVRAYETTETKRGGRVEKFYTIAHGDYAVGSNDEALMRSGWNRLFEGAPAEFEPQPEYDRLNADAFIRLYLDLEPMKTELSDKISAALIFIRNEGLREWAMERLEFVTGTKVIVGEVNFDDDAIRARAYRFLDRGGKHLWNFERGELPGLCGDDVLLSGSGFFPFGRAYAVAMGFIEKSDPAKAREIARNLALVFGGIDFEKEIVPNVGPDYAFIVHRGCEEKKGSDPIVLPCASFFVTTGNDANGKIRAALMSWIGFVRMADKKNAIDVDEGSPDALTLGIRNQPFVGQFRPTVAARDGWLIFSTSAGDYAKAFVGAAGPANARTLVYADLVAIGDYVKSIGPFIVEQEKVKGKLAPEKDLEGLLMLLGVFDKFKIAVEKKDTHGEMTLELTLRGAETRELVE